MSLADVTRPSPDGTLHVPDGWRQGRGAYGGLTIASAIRAIEQRVADPRRVVRAVTAELPAPTLPGEARFTVDVLRSGSSLTVARAALRQGDVVTAHAVVTLAATRAADAPRWRELRAPDAPPWRDVAAIASTTGWPEFAQHFEYRPVAGIPHAGGEPVVLGWVRPRDPGPARDAAFVAAMIDSWYPAALVRLPQMRPMATIAYTLELVDPAPADDAPLLYRGTVAVAGDGFFLETRELWTETGALVALNHQTFAVI